MYPVLLKFGSIQINTYGFLMALGIATAVVVGILRGKKKGFDSDVIIDIAVFGVLGGLVGAKLLYLFTEFPTLLKNPSAIKQMLTGGFVVYGGILGGAFGAYIYCRKKNISFLKHFDLLAPSIAIAQGIGRLGCLAAGCCFGKETDSFLGIVFQHSDYAPNGVKLLPTQLISSIGDLLIAAVLILYARKDRGDGTVGGLYMVLYSIGRFLIEFLRNDPRGEVGFLSTSQFICLFILAVGIALMYKGRKNRVQHEHR